MKIDEFRLTLDSPITEEQWDTITDVDFDNTEEIEFRTKHGKTVRFKKENEGQGLVSNHTYKCSMCGRLLVNIMDGKNNVAKHYPYCHCGADMRGDDNG